MTLHTTNRQCDVGIACRFEIPPRAGSDGKEKSKIRHAASLRMRKYVRKSTFLQQVVPGCQRLQDAAELFLVAETREQSADEDRGASQPNNNADR
jgi:hypothetical protein